MKFEITDRSEYVTRIFSVEDENGNEYIVRFLDNISYTAVEVESLDEGRLLDEEEPLFAELVDLCEAD